MVFNSKKKGLKKETHFSQAMDGIVWSEYLPCNQENRNGMNQEGYAHRLHKCW